jgi:hypothetical protein
MKMVGEVEKYEQEFICGVPRKWFRMLAAIQ